MHQSILKCTKVYQSIPEYTKVYQSIPECTKVYQNVPECTRVYQSVLGGVWYIALRYFFYFGLIEGFEPKTCDVKVKERRKKKETLGELRLLALVLSLTLNYICCCYYIIVT